MIKKVIVGALLLTLLASFPAISAARIRPLSGLHIYNDGLSAEAFATCSYTVKKTLMSLPKEHRDTLKSLVLHDDATLRRGLAGSDIIYARCLDDQMELAGVLVHEMGHVVDLGYMTTFGKSEVSNFWNGSDAMYVDDASVEYYQISWLTEEVAVHKNQEKFVSGYAMSNAFEDFAESYAYYVLHGEKFRYVAQSNLALQRKYDFIRYAVFNGAEFQLELDEKVLTKDRNFVTIVPPFDVTRLRHRLN